MDIRPVMLVLLLALTAHPALAQHPLAQQRQVEVGIGLATPFLQSGTELMRARELRANEQSYFQGPDGAHRAVGRYPALFGFSIHVGFQQPVQRVHGLMLGATARTTLTGSQPSEGGYDEGYFFNSVTTGATAKLYPFARAPLFFRAEAGLGAVLTKNRFRDAGGAQAYHHQFGIGPAAALGIGYSLTPFRGRGTVLDLQALYQQLRTRVEVAGIGNDQWNSGAIHLVASVGF